MPFLGRESESEQRRIERYGAWVRARTPYAPISLGLGLLAVVDCWTLVLGVAAGVAAIVAGRLGLRDLQARPHLIGRRLCLAAMALGVAGLALSVFMWQWGFAMLRRG